MIEANTDMDQLQPPPLEPSRPAGFLIRLVAHLIDSLILTCVSWIVCYVMLAFFYRVGKMTGEFDPAQVQAFMGGLYLIFSFPYYVLTGWKQGASWGKKAVGVRIVDQATLEPITYRQSLLRFLAYAPSTFLMCLGYLMAAFHPRKRALHDLIAGTRCVH